MIKINLTPFEEIDDPRWWVPDAVVMGLVILFTWGGLTYYISTVESEIAEKEAAKVNFTAETENLQSEVQRFADLQTKTVILENKKTALLRITESKLMRYLPVILMENIQNLKPEKVWLNSLNFVDVKKPENQSQPDPNQPPPEQAAVAPGQNGTDFPVTIELQGNAVDNIAVAEFMMALKATQNQNYEKADLRTQLFFSDVAIAFSQIDTSSKGPKEEGKEWIEFKLVLTFREKAAGAPSEAKFSQFIDQFKRTGQASMN